jgi:hypothetical protein
VSHATDIRDARLARAIIKSSLSRRALGADLQVSFLSLSRTHSALSVLPMAQEQSVFAFDGDRRRSDCSRLRRTINKNMQMHHGS